MSIKLKDTIYDLINKANKDGSGNTITSTYLKLSGGTLTGDLEINKTSGSSTFYLTGNSSSLRLFAWSDATYIETGNSDFSTNMPLKITGLGGKTGTDIYLNFSNIYCRGSNYVNIDSGNYSTYAATKDHTHNYAAASHTHSDYVTLTGAQTISGKKTFSGGAAITSASSNNSMPYFLGIDAFADGGTIKYIAKENICSCIGAATASHTHSYAASSHNHDSVYSKLGHTHDYAASSHTHSYLPLSGGTMTGNITVHTGTSGSGLKFGTSTLNSLSNQLLWQSAEAIRFGSSDWDWNSWAGLKYNHSSKIIYLGLADNVIFNANSAQSGGKIYTPGVSNIYIGNGSYVVLHSNNWSTYCAAASHTHSYAASSHTHNYAGSDSSGGKAYDLYAHGGGPGSSNGVGVRWYTMASTSSGAAGYAGTNAGFPVNNNANGMLWLGNHSGPYGGQLGISSNGRLYYRFISNGSFSTSANGGSWNRIAWTSDIPSVPSNVGIFSSTCHSDYNNNQGQLITRSFMSYWTGAYNSNGSSNLTYCKHGAFGTIVTKNAGDYAAASHSHSYIPLSGGTLSSGTSRISRAGSSVSWYQGRANAMMYISSYSGYNAIASMKTTNGDWSMGVYSDNKMYFTYIQDTHYNSSTNTTTAQIVFQPNGYIVGNLSGYATSAGNADTLDGYHASSFSLTSHTHSYASSSHTHNYAGSSSAGGAATSANKLNTNAGSATKPVYFSGGVPVQVTGCMVQYWAIYEIFWGSGGTTSSRVKQAGNFDFLGSVITHERVGQIYIYVNYPEGFSEKTTMIFGNGDHVGSTHTDVGYLTIGKQVYGLETGSGSNAGRLRLSFSDDASTNWGYAYLYFLCIS